MDSKTTTNFDKNIRLFLELSEKLREYTLNHVREYTKSYKILTELRQNRDRYNNITSYFVGNGVNMLLVIEYNINSRTF